MKSRNLIKVLALLTMVVDHVGAVFFPDQVLFRIIGRFAFPAFGYLLALGLDQQKDRSQVLKYMKRLFAFGLLALAPYYFAFGVLRLNIMFTLLCSVAVIGVFRKDLKWFESFPLLLLIPFCEYGVVGVIAVGCAYLVVNRTSLKDKLLASLAFGFANPLVLAGPAALSAFSVVCLANQDIKIPRINKWFYYAFYPLHLALLALAVWLFL